MLLNRFPLEKEQKTTESHGFSMLFELSEAAPVDGVLMVADDDAELTQEVPLSPGAKWSHRISKVVFKSLKFWKNTWAS